MPPLVTVQTHYRVRDAVALLHEHRVSQLPVVSAHDPATIVGAIGERGLLKHAVEDPARARRRDRRGDGAAASPRSRSTIPCATRSSCWSVSSRR